MKMFRDLTVEEEGPFRAWAREHYRPFQPIEGIWHPVVQDECRRMNEEAGQDVTPADLGAEHIQAAVRRVIRDGR